MSGKDGGQALHPFLREFLDHLTLERGAARATREAYRRDILQHLAWLEEKKIPFPEGVGDPAVADAILDRLIHNSHRIELSGESMRKLEQTGPLK